MGLNCNREMASQLQRSTSLIQQNAQLLAALREISADPTFDAEKHPAVMMLLPELCTYSVAQEDLHVVLSTGQYSDPECPDDVGFTNGEGRGSQPSPHSEAESDVAGSVDSLDAMDRMVPLVSLGIGSGASGYVGQSSEISWLQRAQEHMFGQQELGENNPDGSHLDYHMDEANLLAVDEDSVDPMEVPPLPIARILADSYFETVHASFPLVDQSEFMEVLISQIHSRPPLTWNGRRWLSMANIIFAVGAKWLYMTRPRGPDMQGPNIGPGDHIVYYARARSLGLDHRLIMDHPLIGQIQALGILGLYLIVNHQISRYVPGFVSVFSQSAKTQCRAWTTVGHAIRHAIALGLHLRMGAGIESHQQQVRSCTWWSLYGLEQLLGNFTGRPTSILDTDIAIPLDLTSKSASACRPAQQFALSKGTQPALSDFPPVWQQNLPYSPHLYFVWRIRLSVVGHQIRSSLYGSGRRTESWARILESIRKSDQDLKRWCINLPEELKLSPGIDIHPSDPHDAQLLNHFELALAYQSTRMILFRPCLCPLEGAMSPELSALSQSSIQEGAISCVSAARTMLALLPNHAVSCHTSKILPWWSLLHYITQAGAVLILELCLKAKHMPSQVKELFGDMMKVMAWLAGTAADSLSAWRSWNIFRKLCLQAAAVVGIDITIPEDIRKPPEWDATYEHRTSRTLSPASHQQTNHQPSSHPNQQPEMSPVRSAGALFPTIGQLSDDSWLVISSMPNSADHLAFNGRHAYSRSMDDAASKMDWKASHGLSESYSQHSGLT